MQVLMLIAMLSNCSSSISVLYGDAINILLIFYLIVVLPVDVTMTQHRWRNEIRLVIH